MEPVSAPYLTSAPTETAKVQNQTKNIYIEEGAATAQAKTSTPA